MLKSPPDMTGSSEFNCLKSQRWRDTQLSEVPREADQQHPRAAVLMGNLKEIPAKRKSVSLLYISIGKNARKMLLDNFPQIKILLIELRKLVQHCTECFQMRSNWTLDRHMFLSRKQKPSESLNQF